MKILQVDNLDREGHDEVVVASNVPDKLAREIAIMLNEKYSGASEHFYRAVADDYVPYKWAP